MAAPPVPPRSSCVNASAQTELSFETVEVHKKYSEREELIELNIDMGEHYIKLRFILV